MPGPITVAGEQTDEMSAAATLFERKYASIRPQLNEACKLSSQHRNLVLADPRG